MNIIYRIVNTVSGKSYIGQTIQPLKKRFAQHFEQSRAGTKGRLYDALRKYPKEVFELSWVCSVLDQKDLDDLEVYFIAKYNTFHKGYNQTAGGKQGGYSHTQEAKQAISRKMKGRKNTWSEKIVQSRIANGGNYESRVVYFRVVTPDGSEEIGRNLTKYCRDHSVSVSNLWETFHGKRSHTKGYKLLGTFIDYPFGEYTQASGNGGQPVRVDDIVKSL